MNAEQSKVFSETLQPGTAEEAAAHIITAAEAGTPVFPVGGGTALPAAARTTANARGLSLAQMSRVIDYPHDDMTITLEAGVTFAQLQAVLAKHNQRLPVDVPQADRATVGGAIAVNESGPRRYGWGSLRDYVIGVTAIDGRGVTFSAGGRVVKNVAGYDFCKLLIGSRGTLAVITQVTLKVLPAPECGAMLVGAVRDFDQLAQALDGVAEAAAQPTSVEFAGGSAAEQILTRADVDGGRKAGDCGVIALGFEGTRDEIDWAVEDIATTARSWSVRLRRVDDAATPDVWTALSEFPAGDDSKITFKANMLPSGVAGFCEQAQQADPACSLIARAGNGLVFARMSLPAADCVSAHAATLLPLARKLAGNCLVYAAPADAELTTQARSGAPNDATAVRNRIKSTFDPHGILSPGA